MKTRVLAVVIAAVIAVSVGLPIASAASPALAQSVSSQMSPDSNRPVNHYIVWTSDYAKQNHGQGVYGELSYGNIVVSGRRGDGCMRAYSSGGATIVGLLVTASYRHGNPPYASTTWQLMPAYRAVQNSKWCLPDSYASYDIDFVGLKTTAPPFYSS